MMRILIILQIVLFSSCKTDLDFQIEPHQDLLFESQAYPVFNWVKKSMLVKTGSLKHKVFLAWPGLV